MTAKTQKQAAKIGVIPSARGVGEPLTSTDEENHLTWANAWTGIAAATITTSATLVAARAMFAAILMHVLSGRSRT